MKGKKNASPQQSNLFEDLELPEGWSLTKIRDLVTINYGKGLKEAVRAGGSISVFGSNGIVGSHNKALTDGPSIIIGRKGSIGEVHYSANPSWPIDTTYYIDKFEGIDPTFLVFALKSLNLSDLDTSTAIPGLNRNDIYDQEIPLPPLPEQQRIVARIEALLTQVNAARDRLSRVPLIMKKFRQAVLAAACSGRLTEGWRGENVEIESAAELLKRIEIERRSVWQQCSKTQMIKRSQKKCYPQPQNVDVEDLSPLPESWLWVTLDQIVQENRPIVYGIIKPGPDTPGGVLYVRVNEMEDGEFIDVSKLRRASNEIAKKYARASLNAGDLLISKDGTIGRTALVPPELAGGNITQHTVRVSIHPIIDKIFIMRTVQSQFSQQWLEAEKKGVALQGVNVEDFRRLPLPLPPLAEQYEIVRRVGLLFERADAIDREVEAAGRRCERLTQAVLARAFRGEIRGSRNDSN